ncbi:tetratricopeptide repeat protein [Sporohalobacter salinus]|uniref:tetratricopeptide repeat protein n=1 Tax=Sporohalobacter salinus TaxID=1494606 RepID=UPI001960A3CB|nr:bacterial transcriptional activator domain-containing protein [Sporohalobacter salinus]MBM7624819.1 hypothetical protein [Sporohalobacter salinus]
MNLLYWIFNLIITAVEITILIFMFYKAYFSLELFIICHLLISLLYWRLNRQLKNNFSLAYYLVLLMPGIGLVVVTIINFLLQAKGTSDGLISDYEEYLSFVESFTEETEVDLDEELNQLSILDKLKYSSEQEKKQAIINFTTEDISLQVDILKEALTDDNPEVAHYAASTLNLLETNFEEKIEELMIEYRQTNEIDYLGELIEEYEYYIESSLLKAEVKSVYVQDYIEILLEAKEKFKSVYEIDLKLTKAYKQLEKYEKAIGLLQELIKQYPYRYEAYLKLMELYYDLDQESKMLELIEKIEGLEIHLPEEVRKQIEFWQ